MKLTFRKDKSTIYTRYTVHRGDTFLGWVYPTTAIAAHSRWEAEDPDHYLVCTGSTRREVAWTLDARIPTDTPAP